VALHPLGHRRTYTWERACGCPRSNQHGTPVDIGAVDDRLSHEDAVLRVAAVACDIVDASPVAATTSVDVGLR